MHLIALQEFHYDGKTRKIGDTFEAQDLHGRMFIESKRAARFESKVLSTRTYETAAVTADKAEAEQAAIPHNPRAKYKRRDMRAGE